jgi:hypothetical protein
MMTPSNTFFELVVSDHPTPTGNQFEVHFTKAPRATCRKRYAAMQDGASGDSNGRRATARNACPDGKACPACNPHQIRFAAPGLLISGALASKPKGRVVLVALQKVSQHGWQN